MIVDDTLDVTNDDSEVVSISDDRGIVSEDVSIATNLETSHEL